MHDFEGYFSRTFQHLKLSFPGLSRTKVIFQDFPDTRIFFEEKKSRTFQEAWEPRSDHRSQASINNIAATWTMQRISQLFSGFVASLQIFHPKKFPNSGTLGPDTEPDCHQNLNGWSLSHFPALCLQNLMKIQ